MTHISAEKETAHDQRWLLCCSHVGVWEFRMSCDVTRLMPCQQKMEGKFSISTKCMRAHTHTHKDGFRINQDLIILFRFLLILKLYHYQKINLSKKKIWEPISFISACRRIFFFFFLLPLLQPFKAVLPAAESSSPPQYNGLLASPRRHLLLQLLALSTSSSSGLVKAGGRQQLTPRRSPGDN